VATLAAPRFGNESFTGLSRGCYRRVLAKAHTPGMELTGRLLFVGVVTCYLLGRIFTGEATPVETVVYGVTAAFGLEFLVASWGDVWRRA
jgi:hypothetical protein